MYFINKIFLQIILLTLLIQLINCKCKWQFEIDCNNLNNQCCNYSKQQFYCSRTYSNNNKLLPRYQCLKRKCFNLNENCGDDDRCCYGYRCGEEGKCIKCELDNKKCIYSKTANFYLITSIY
ncbi:hypothetical protein Mgra_00008394 [Meloidogyne graminicola]|uniref:Uncharacterized protein n=1 Tax=Meloidogyne graminicola TaxID=189291 RepID=A0A8S9ZFX6_9BILA|nr:hypothetical protein Mgra_00008394 [Meloidogyne graminicola]